MSPRLPASLATDYYVIDASSISSYTDDSSNARYLEVLPFRATSEDDIVGEEPHTLFGFGALHCDILYQRREMRFVPSRPRKKGFRSSIARTAIAQDNQSSPSKHVHAERSPLRPKSTNCANKSILQDCTGRVYSPSFKMGSPVKSKGPSLTRGSENKPLGSMRLPRSVPAAGRH
ncbi:hypothetical protein PLICRDRAFT_121208 [Plicaturopsis crispa FD-325 SS-3]|nr:hypothetical protein PLICRDRAFT_121208 [Plicaturopsis crispa FD-325 SS-3]